MAGEQEFPTLFSEVAVGRHRLRNRIAHLATLTNLAAGNRVTDRLVDYHAARAAGGAAMSIVEGLAVHPSSVPLTTCVTLFDDANGDGLKRLAAAGEAHDCRMLGQLWHVGRQQLWNPIDSPVGVSDQPDAFSWTVPHVLREDEIAELVDAFVDGARRLKAAGFSGAELHGAHGYLITQFLSPWSNNRDDAYGGDLERRLRFVAEIIAGIRAACGDEFLLGLKMPAAEGVAGGIDGDEAERITRALAAGGIDYFAYSQGNFSPSLEDHTPDMHYRPGPFLELHKRMRAAAGGVPVMAVGRVIDAAHAEHVLADGTADLVGLCRPLVADPALPLKAREGRAAEIRPCIFCNLCWGEIHAGKPLLCIHNPKVGAADEADWHPAPAATKRRVAVAGAGPAGLEAAWVAAARGHAVTLYGASAEPGGRLRLDAALPGRAEVAKVYEFQVAQAARHGVEMVLGQAVGVDEIAARRPDLVLLATGSEQRAVDGFEADGPVLSGRAAAAELTAETEPRGGTAVLFDMDHSDPTYALAELMAARFDALVLLTPRPLIARQTPHVNALGIYRRLYGAGVEIVTTATPLSYLGGTVVYANPLSGAARRIDDVRLFVHATPRRAADTLYAPLRALGLEARLIGDARAPRNIFSAIHEGFHVANAI